jgi:hypothetical protein
MVEGRIVDSEIIQRFEPEGRIIDTSAIRKRVRTKNGIAKLVRQHGGF